MKKQQKLITLGVLTIFSCIFMSCGNNSSSEKTEENKIPETTTETTNKTTSEPQQSKEAEITGVYSGTDNVGMETTIILNSEGSMIVQPSVGNGTPAYGNWSGTANSLSLYISDDMGGEQLLGDAKITEQGLKIIGGKFYSRK